MGHIRLGRLPKTRKWQEVVGLVDAGADTAGIAAATLDASRRGKKFRAPETIRGDNRFKIREPENPTCAVRSCNRTLSVPSAGPRHGQRSRILQYLRPRRFQRELL